MLVSIATFSGAVVAAAFVATFVEYWGHRLMHRGRFLRKRHARHHQRGTGQGWLGEFRDYALPSLPVSVLGFAVSVEAGLGFFAGAMGYAAFAAYAHQLQHERPTAVFWMAQPVHAVHHYHREWHHNFGITTGLWDRVFGTYRAHPPAPELAALDRGQGRLDIHWASPSAPLPQKRRDRDRP